MIACLRQCSTVTLLAAAAILPMHAWAFDIKPGLWEVKTETTLPGNIAMPSMSALPPEVQAKLQQNGIQLQGGRSNEVTARACITPEQAKRGEPPQPKDSHCQAGAFQRNGDIVSWQMTCTQGGRTVQGTGKIIMLTPENYTGSTHVTMSDPQHGSLSTTTQMEGHWLSANCQ